MLLLDQEQKEKFLCDGVIIHHSLLRRLELTVIIENIPHFPRIHHLILAI